VSNLPVEWKAQLAHLPNHEVKRLENLIDRGITHPLNEEKEQGAFLMFILKGDLDYVASNTGVPKDVITLTYLKYRWAEKRSLIMDGGIEKVIDGMTKEMYNTILFATYKALTDKASQVLSGKETQYEKLSWMPRSFSGLEQLVNAVRKINGLDNGDGEPVKPGNTVVNAQNVQINQQIEPVKEEQVVKRLSREERLAKMAEKNK
jgi:hypothetical protein